jgi:hypothetical protein
MVPFDFCYHHLNTDGKLMAGKCISTPCYLFDGKLVLQEKWRWLTGERSKGYSEVE